MSVTNILEYDIPVLRPEDTGDRAMQILEESNIFQVPVVANDQYIALIKQDDLLDWETPELPVSQSHFLHFSPAVYNDNHPYEALKVAHNFNLMVVPVIDRENKYIGSVTRETILNFIAEHSGLENPGGILVLEIKPVDYSLYELVRIAESEEVTILSTSLHNNRASGMLELTIKTNRTVLDNLATTYERFGYTVKEMYGENANKQDLIDRYNLLMAYINM